ncbi:glyoxalase [Pseudonocardia endophytica]|uniref:Putative glyoxalase superfamily protein PhnB n=1 Tax=Pseudonocardia endophytica TaxID=401976 RepID=A0A4R1HQN7_PSEEN|nr:glyoxalase [Pseudonocardia endophytica]TCK23045.1 putative glyoxalase superfamily protein PhnB [Pseudonocardia endophytica]
MNALRSVTLEVPDPDAARAFHKSVLGADLPVHVRAGDSPTSGFRGYTLSLVVARPGMVDSLATAALDTGATTIKPVAKSFWGYGCALRGPDGAVWTFASSSKRHDGPAEPVIDSTVLLLGVAAVTASRQFYTGRGLTAAKSFGGRYVEFDRGGSPITLALLGRKALAKNGGVDPDGTGSSRIVLGGDTDPFTDPDGFVWETSS